MLLPFWISEVGMWPDRRIALKIPVRMSVRRGGANFMCSLVRLSWPAEIRTSISSFVISSG